MSGIGAWTETITDMLPPNKRYITGHDASGKSVFKESPPQLYHGRENVGGMARSYAVSKIPAVLKDEADIKAYRSDDPAQHPTSYKATDIVVPNGTGANLVVVDLMPGGESQLHQTVSIDFSICVIGDIISEQDNGEQVHLKPGVRVSRNVFVEVLMSVQDHIIQRGTMHKWINPSKTNAARFVAVTLPCEPFEIAGKMLEEVHLKGTGPLQEDGSRL